MTAAAGKLIGQTVVDVVAVVIAAVVVLDARDLVLQQTVAVLALAHIRVVGVDTQLRAQPVEALAKVHYER